MDHLMLLGGQFLQARIPDGHERDSASAATRSREFWDGVDAVDRDVFDVYGFAARLVIGLVALGAVFATLSVAAPSGAKPPMACLECPAMWP